MHNIAQENNLSETNFLVRNGKQHELRRFTPGKEIDLCVHATLGAAYVLWRFAEINRTSFSFQTKSGQLAATRNRNLIEIELPASPLVLIPVTDKMETAISIRPAKAWMVRNMLCVLQEEQVISATPDEKQLKALDKLLLHLTAKSQTYDCITPQFSPKLGILKPCLRFRPLPYHSLWAAKPGKIAFYTVSEIHVPAWVMYRQQGLANRLQRCSHLYQSCLGLAQSAPINPVILTDTN